MSLERWYRLSAYVTLGLSCCALVFAEAPFLPDLQVCLAPVLALLVLGWWVEGRWSLPNRGADVLGLLIVASGASWLLAHRTDEELVLTQIPWHLALLPFMGPLLMAALLVKVFRTRGAGDFWYLQGLGLTQVGLGCVLEGGPAFGAAMAIYLASAIVCLALHYRHAARVKSEEGRVRSEKKKSIRRSSLLTPHSSLLPFSPVPRTERAGWWLASFTLRWTLLVALPALLLFLLTPRRDNWAWEPLNNFRSGRNRLRVKGGGEAMNLNDTGRLEPNDEVSFTVSAFDAVGHPKGDLSPEQRWRSTVFDWYEHGTWSKLHLPPADLFPVRQNRLPNFGRDSFSLLFTVQPRRAGALVLAEPIRFGPPSARLPVLSLADNGRKRLFAEHSGTLLPVEISNELPEYRYQQVVPTHGDPARTPVEQLSSKMIQHLDYLPAPLQVELHSWTRDLLVRLSQDSRYRFPNRLRADLAKKNERLVVAAEEREATARVLCDYLAHSGDFAYSLDIARQDRMIDPVLDFLVNVKKGHCELYAAALAAMLRSVAVPARIVKGFRGWNSKGDGQYVIRHRHAHAWVEILVQRPRFEQGMRFLRFQEARYDWLTLDPTPPAAAVEARAMSLTNLWEVAQQFCLQWWRALIIDYNGEEQADLWNTLISSRPLPVLLKLLAAGLALGAALAAWLIWRRLRVRRRTASLRGTGEDASIYARLVRILSRHASLRPEIGQTPREYADAAQAILQARPDSVALSGWLRRVIELFYRVRFGGQPLQEEERQILNQEFEGFAKTLRQSGA